MLGWSCTRTDGVEQSKEAECTEAVRQGYPQHQSQHSTLGVLRLMIRAGDLTSIPCGQAGLVDDVGGSGAAGVTRKGMWTHYAAESGDNARPRS